MSELRKLRCQINDLTQLLEYNPSNSYHPTLNLLSIKPPARYPIQSRWYMPFLLRHCSSSLLALNKLCEYVRPYSLTYLSIDQDAISPMVSRVERGKQVLSLPVSWMQACLADPCMFHSILFAASTHLDKIRKEHDNPITHYHRRNAIQLLLQGISQNDKVPNTSVAAALYLWLYEVSESPVCLGRKSSL